MDRNESIRLLNDLQKKFGSGNHVRETMSGFGQGFGESYSQMAIESGDLFHSLIGEGISAMSNVIAEASKSSGQRTVESRLKFLSDRIDAKEKLANWSMISSVISSAILIWLSVIGRVPL